MNQRNDSTAIEKELATRSLRFGRFLPGRRFSAGRRGLTLVEIMLAMLIISLVMLSVSRAFFTMSKATVQTQERTFAAQKAIQMLEELRGLVSTTSNSAIGVLDDYDDGTVMNQVLTTKKYVSDPADQLSGNGHRKFVRNINVLPVPNEPLARQVFVRVYLADGHKPLAETMSVIRTITNQYATSQVFDVYVLSLENVPGWWVSLSSMKPMFDNVMQDVQTRNPGLEFRTHWITRLAYGRDPYYTPFINEATKTNLVSPTKIYFYPGNMDKPSVGAFFYYVPSSFAGRVNIDGTIANTASYTIADQYNHGVRYPDEEALYQNDVDAAVASGRSPPEMSLRMLLENINKHPDIMQNLMIINLHGELIPMPPMRNYSDAAKSPTTMPNVRVVTHPEQLEYPAGSTVKLRVYAYTANPDSWATDATLSTMTVVLSSGGLSAGDISIRRMVGNASTAYGWQDAVAGTDYDLTILSSSETLVKLYNTPLRTAPNGNDGLASSARLYGLEYIPCVVASNTAGFAEGERDLGWDSTTHPKNTARWKIQIATGTYGTLRLSVTTRIGQDLTTGTLLNDPYNASRTYTWIGSSAPITERYQFLGDPRHMPYADVKANEGYNWYFRSVVAADYDGFGRAANGWDGTINVDLPRYFQMFRGGLLATRGVWTSMTGYSFYYIGIGGEMGYDSSNGFASGLPIIRTPWVPTSSSQIGVDEITNAQDEPYHRVISAADNSWWGLFWLGELFPDSAAATWIATGNLPVGTYYRAKYSAKGFSFDPQKRNAAKGCSTFFNGNNLGTGVNTFNHDSMDTTNGIIAGAGLQVSQDFNFPLLASMLARRPFRLDHSSADRRPPEWATPAYTAQRTTLSTLETYYETEGNQATHDSSALVRAKVGTDVANFVINGLSPQTDFGAAQISKLCAVNLVRAFMSAGAPTVTDAPIPQVPLVHISSPAVAEEFDDPATIPVHWETSWRRWDTRPYTEAYPDDFTDAETVVYMVKYSNDNAHTWHFVDDDSLTTQGARDDSHAVTPPYDWDTSAKPRGTYILRVEGFRANRALHYTYHQRQVYIQR